MLSCVICIKSLSSRSSGIQCNKCNAFLHANGRCSEVTKNQVPLIRNMPGGRWICAGCRDGGNPSASSPTVTHVSPMSCPAPVLPRTDSGLDAVIADAGLARLMNALRSELGAMRSEIRELKESVSFCSDKISDFEEKLAKLSEVFRLANHLKAENDCLKKEVSSLQYRMDSLEQNARENNVEIVNIPEKQNENLIEIVKKVGEFAGMIIESSSLSSVVRVPTRVENRPKNIIAKFISKSKRDEFLSTIKNKRSTNSGRNGFSLDGLSNKFYVNEHLTTKNKSIFRSARITAREKNYKYVWTQNGNILMRMNETSKIIHIQNESDLAKFK